MSRTFLALILSAACLGIALWAVRGAGLLAALASLGRAAPALAFALMLAAFQLSLLRYQFILESFGQRVSLTDATRAVFLGTLGALAPIAVVGQTLARWAVLRQSGVSASVVIATTIYERGLVLLALVPMSCLAGLLLLARPASHWEPEYAPLLKTLPVLALTIAVVSFLLRRPLRVLARTIVPRLTIPGFGFHLLLTGVMQATTLAAYYVLARLVAPDVATSHLMAAIILVMAVGSFPVSVGGWGFRELGALFALGFVGIGKADAVAIAVTVGAASTLAAALLAVFSTAGQKGPAPAEAVVRASGARRNLGKLLAKATPLLVAALISFHIWVPLANGTLNINLADPFALLGGSIAAILLARGSLLNSERIRAFFWIFALGSSAIILLALAVGAWRYGFVSWAVLNRGLGWLVVLGYFATGCLAVLALPRIGLKLAAKVLIASALTIIAAEVFLRVAPLVSPDVPAFSAAWQLSGESGNPNAFAFHLLLLLGCVLLLFSTSRRPSRLVTAGAAVFFIAILGTYSRAALVALPICGGLATALKIFKAPRLRRDAAIGFGAILLTGVVIALVYRISMPDDVFESLALVRVGSDGARWVTVIQGLKLFAEHPILGAGLGGALRSQSVSGEPLVIHSTPVWMLAELGLVGALFFGAVFWWVFRRLLTLSRSHGRPEAATGIWVLLTFLVFGLAHDIFYQRLFWFLLGACITASLARSESSHHSFSIAKPPNSDRPTVRGSEG